MLTTPKGPVFERFVLYESALINGKIRPSGLQNLTVPLSRVEKQYPTPEQLAADPAGFGGYLPKLIFADVLAGEKAANPNAKPEEVWAWLPPPLAGEGSKVQTAWLHDFLLDPQPIRPAVVLRMPKFNMSSAEASALVAYFAAADNADYPYDFDPRTRQSYLTATAEKEDNPHRLADGLKIVTDNNYCVKCHLLGDFEPTGSDRAKGPRLDLVYKRLRPDYTLGWLADPKRILPYTAMPVNIPFDKPVSDALYHGTSVEQLNGVVDLLMNYDRFIEDRTSIKPLIKPAPASRRRRPGRLIRVPVFHARRRCNEPRLRFSTRIVKPRWAFYNAVLLAAVLAPAIGCGGKPTPPPPARRKKLASSGRRAWR